jgi:hypothetical protein
VIEPFSDRAVGLVDLDVTLAVRSTEVNTESESLELGHDKKPRWVLVGKYREVAHDG